MDESRQSTGGGFRHGAFPLDGERTRFSVWAPRAELVELEVGDKAAGALAPAGDGYHAGVFRAPPGARYRYRLDGGGPFADPASRSQPDGVHGPSEVVATDPAEPCDGWRGVPLAAQVVCEVHVGTFSDAGTFDGVAERLDELADAGYTVVELMPVAAFPGARNWGYDGVFPFAVQDSYGGRAGLARLCAAAHRRGLAVVVDVVYNHLGPEGSVLEEYGPYLTDRYRTPWGKAVNVDGAGSDEVRRYFVEQALSSVCELDVDGFRLDAVHEIADMTASPFVAELAAAVHAEGRRLGRTLSVVAESPANDPRLVTSAEAGGVGCDGVWNDDFHHALRTALTGQRDRYFGDYRGVRDLATACTDGFVVAGRWSPSRRRHHGAAPSRPLGGQHLVVFAQNHDQIGNGGFGRRLAAALPLDAQFPIAAAVLCSGWVPLRFMGEEYGETAPFHYFTDHGDRQLAEAVRHGRSEEIGHQSGEPPPDPQDPTTFTACRIDRSLAQHGVHAELLAWQRRLLDLRRREPALGCIEPERSECWVDPGAGALVLLRHGDPYLGGRPVAVVALLRPNPAEIAPPLLAGTRLEPLAWRGVPGVAVGGILSPGVHGAAGVHGAPGSPADSPRLALDGYGTLVAAVHAP
ncbi:MAG: malto-oligosyltrehalose trehalohydrolase [Acidimicrobiales bacterium]